MPSHSTASDPIISNIAAYPVFASKAEYLTAVENANERGELSERREVLYRLSNSDTSTWADPTARHDA